MVLIFCNIYAFATWFFNSIRKIIDNTKDKPTLKFNRFYLSDLKNNHLTHFYQLSLILRVEKKVILISNTESVIFLLNFHAD